MFLINNLKGLIVFIVVMGLFLLGKYIYQRINSI